MQDNGKEGVSTSSFRYSCRIPFAQNSRKCKLTYNDRKQISGNLGLGEGQEKVGRGVRNGQKETGGMGEGHTHYLIEFKIDQSVYFNQFISINPN